MTLVLKHKHKRKDHTFSFSSCLRLCLRSLALSKNGRDASTTSRFYSQRRVEREHGTSEFYVSVSCACLRVMVRFHLPRIPCACVDACDCAGIASENQAL